MKPINRIYRIAAVLYAGLLLWMLLCRHPDPMVLPYWQHARMHRNLIPFRSIRLFLRLLAHPSRSFIRLAVFNLAGNILLFIPMGVLLPAVFPRLNRFWKVMLAQLLIMLVLETAQMLLLVGTCDVDDLILNSMGAALGWCLFRALHPPESV